MKKVRWNKEHSKKLFLLWQNDIRDLDNICLKMKLSKQQVKNAIYRLGLNNKGDNVINSITLRKQAELLLKEASSLEKQEQFIKNKTMILQKINDVINHYDHLGDKIEELKKLINQD